MTNFEKIKNMNVEERLKAFAISPIKHTDDFCKGLSDEVWQDITTAARADCVCKAIKGSIFNQKCNEIQADLSKCVECTFEWLQSEAD